MHPRPIQPDGRLHGVVVAIAREDGRFLCVRRSRHVRAPRKVCFPGGAIEIGESQQSAVKREMKEELGIDVEPVAQCWKWDSPDSPLTLWGWTASWISSQIQPEASEIEEVLWLSGQEVSDHVDALGTNREFVKCLKNSLASMKDSLST